MSDGLRALLKSYAPQRLLKFLLRTTRRWLRRQKFKGIGRYVQRDVIDKTRLTGDLRALGLQAGDTVLVHSSLSSLGYVEGGADTVIDALLAAIAPGGTLAMPTFAGGRMLDYVQSGVVFDVRTTPSHTGKITEVFRQREGVLRSLHPTHSVAALGPNAKRLTEGHERCPVALGPGSPFVRLIELGGKILCLGVEISYITSYHAFEDLTPDFPEPVYVAESFSCSVVGYDGNITTVVTRAHDPVIAARRIEKRPDKLREIKRLFREEGILSEGHVGKANAYLMSAKRMNDVLGKLLRMGITIYASE